MVQTQEETANIQEYKVDNNANITIFMKQLVETTNRD